jgi:hypothetical protein
MTDSTMPPIPPDPKGVKKRDPLYITVIIVLLGSLAFCAYQWNFHSSGQAICELENQELSFYIKEMEADLGSSGLELMSTDVRENLQAMLQQMDTLQTDNQVMLDSIRDQRERVTGLLAELDGMKKKGKRDARTIYKLRKETETLRKVMRFQVHRIDSLNQMNIQYRGEIEEQVATINKKDDEIKDLTSVRKGLEEQVNIGSKLQTSGIKADALRVRASGNYKETPRAKSTNMIRACFTIMGNPIANSGDKAIFMRIISPSGGVLNDGSPELFQTEGAEQEASVKRVVNYQKENMDLCIFYDVENEIDPGDYIVKIFCEGVEIATTSFALK